MALDEESHFLPTMSDLSAIERNLVVLVSRVLCQYINVLNPQKRSLVMHIPHAHSAEMATKSEVAVLDMSSTRTRTKVQT